MSAYQILLHELAQHGQTTYKALCRKYGGQGYDYHTFTAAVHKARKLGIVERARGRGKPIIAVGCCPCCGREL